jgi:hypothetical protein
MPATQTDLHPQLAKINATCPAYYAACADEYVALLDRADRNAIDLNEAKRVAMRDCFYVAVPPAVNAGFIMTLSDEPTRGERMLVRSLAKIPAV